MWSMRPLLDSETEREKTVEAMESKTSSLLAGAQVPRLREYKTVKNSFSG